MQVTTIEHTHPIVVGRKALILLCGVRLRVVVGVRPRLSPERQLTISMFTLARSWLQSLEAVYFQAPTHTATFEIYSQADGRTAWRVHVGRRR